MKTNGILSVLLTLAPLTGDEGMSGLILPITIGVVLVLAFIGLTIIQKKRKQNKDDDSDSDK